MGTSGRVPRRHVGLPRARGDSGRVIPQDLVEAAILKGLVAARFGSGLDKQAADIEKDLTPEQRAQVAARAEEIRTHFRR